MSNLAPSRKFEANDTEIRPVTAPNNMRHYEMPPENEQIVFYCDNCKKQFDYNLTIPKMVPCQEKHIFCEECLKQSGKCFIDNYEFKALPEDLQTVSYLQLKNYMLKKKIN